MSSCSDSSESESESGSPQKSRLTPLEEKEADPSLNIIADARHVAWPKLTVRPFLSVSTISSPSREHSIEALAEYWKKKGVKNVVVLSGAGISTSAGIPDFRSPGTGLYDNLQ
ncbi:hypothetical protein BDK51DRAFT_27478, partial [Blyttiomyces helicus]